MKCAFCRHGKTHSGLVTVTLDRHEQIVVLKGVPADICDNCGEYYLSEDVTGQVLARAELLLDHGNEVEIFPSVA